MNEKCEDNDYITIPRKLLETIYTDYLLFDNNYPPLIEEEIGNTRDGDYWENIEENKTIKIIKYYLKK